MTDTRSPATSPYVRHGDFIVCITCTTLNQGRGSAADAGRVITTDPITHAEECHPETVLSVQAAFAPVHAKIRRSAV